jgi:hypothetical protein
MCRIRHILSPRLLLRPWSRASLRVEIRPLASRDVEGISIRRRTLLLSFCWNNSFVHYCVWSGISYTTWYYTLVVQRRILMKILCANLFLASLHSTGVYIGDQFPPRTSIQFNSILCSAPNHYFILVIPYLFSFFSPALYPRI